MDDNAPQQPPPQNGNRPDRARDFLGMMTEILVGAGIGFATPISVMVVDDDGVPREWRTTPAQLMLDLTESIKDLTASNDERLEFDEGLLEAAEEEEAPRRKPRRR